MGGGVEIAGEEDGGLVGDSGGDVGEHALDLGEASAGSFDLSEGLGGGGSFVAELVGAVGVGGEVAVVDEDGLAGGEDDFDSAPVDVGDVEGLGDWEAGEDSGFGGGVVAEGICESLEVGSGLLDADDIGLGGFDGGDRLGEWLVAGASYPYVVGHDTEVGGGLGGASDGQGGGEGCGEGGEHGWWD